MARKIGGVEVHASVTADRIMDGCMRRDTSLDNPGICIACGADHDECEPDAREYECDECGKNAVYGCEELALYMF